MLQQRESEPGSMQANLTFSKSQAAFAGVVAETEEFLMRSAIKRTGGDIYGAEEIIQETYIKAFKGLESLRGDSKIETWLHIIMFNCLKDYYTKQAKHGQDLSIDEYPYDVPADRYGEDNPESIVLHRELQEEIRQRLSAIGPRYKAGVFLVYFAGKTHKEAGKFLGVSAGGSKAIVSRGIAMLRNAKQNHQAE